MPKEQTIISTFPSMTKAEAAKTALANAGLTDSSIKRSSRYGVSTDDEMDSAISSAETLTGLTLFSANTSKESKTVERVLMGADPSVSGFSMSGNPLAGGHAFTLVVFAPPNRVDEAVTIIKQNGGEV